MKLKTTSIIALCMMVSACAFTTDEVKDRNAEKTAQDVLAEHQKREVERFSVESGDGRLTDKNVKIEFKDSSVIGVYRMRVTWPQSAPNILVEHEDFTQSFLGNEFYETSINHSQETVISITSRDSKGSVINKKVFHVQAPKDLIVKRDIHLRADTLYDVKKVYFASQSRIYTNGYNLNIVAEKIIVEDIEQACEKVSDPHCIDTEEFPSLINIQTTHPDNEAIVNYQSSGSKISIEAKEAYGTLRIAAIGFNGKDGRSGSELDKISGRNISVSDISLKGISGKDAETAQETEPCGFRGGNIDTPCEKSVIRCTSHPTNGAPGKTGAAGTPGENGQNGGNTGDIYVNVSSSPKFLIKVWQKPGQGGNGGAGGPGSVGGPGGDPGKNLSPCTAAQPGPPGASGPSGKNGENGKTGEIGRIQVLGALVETFPL